MTVPTAPPAPARPRAALDLLGLLDPATGLVRVHSVEPPGVAGDGLWRVAIQLACPHSPPASSTALASCVTGACALTRRDALVRAVGEAVERLALHGGPEATSGTPYDGSGLAALHAPPTRPVRRYAGTRARDGARLLVPAGLVDYPAESERPEFDPGPSGTASGIGHEQALRSALLETIERDAVIVSWTRRRRTRAIDVDALLAGGAPDASWRRVADLLALVRRGGREPVLAELPLSVPGLVCVVGGVRVDTPTGPSLCVGAKVSDDPGHAIAGALEESLQLYRSVLALRAAATEPPPTVITGDNDRLAFLASPRGAASLAAWLADPLPSTYPLSLPPLGTDDLLAALLADGLDPVVLDLTDRLPERVRAMGWSVVKVVPDGYQPLRIDERTTYGWNERRLGPGTRCPDPHPLP